MTWLMILEMPGMTVKEFMFERKHFFVDIAEVAMNV